MKPIFRSSPTRRHVVLVGLILTLAASSGCSGESNASGDPAEATSVSPPASAEPTQEEPNEQTPSEISAQFADPVRVSIPAVDLSAELEPLGLNKTGELEPPDYGLAGWYEDGPEPGEPGAAVIAGHLDSKVGPDTFYNLGQVKVGERILLELVDGSELTFRIVDMGQYPVDEFPTAKVYGQTSDPKLRLITCAGDYDHGEGHYEDNLVVFADLAS